MFSYIAWLSLDFLISKQICGRYHIPCNGFGTHLYYLLFEHKTGIVALLPSSAYKSS